jgi:N-acetylglucosamine-6-sulfatase
MTRIRTGLAPRRGRQVSARLVTLAATVAVLPGALSVPAGAGAVSPAGAFSRPNIILVLTDDQSPDTIPRTPAVMPKLQGMLEDPADHWIRFPSSFDTDPLCCPSRSSILTGQYPHHTGVTTDSGTLFDDSSTIATWLRGAGYWTGLVGRYFNKYPFRREPFVPPGWDRWAANAGGSEDYYSYTLDQCPVAFGTPSAPSCSDGPATSVAYGSDPVLDYHTTVVTRLALQFLDTAPSNEPFFLYFAPFAPHGHHVAEPKYRGAYAGTAPTVLPDFNESDVSDKPAWVRALPVLDARHAARQHDRRRRQFEQLLSVDDAVQEIVDDLRAQGKLDDTVIVYMTDNGFSYGEHRWAGKRCPYDECVRTPFFVRYPGATPHADQRIVGNIDVAPTFSQLAGVTPPLQEDGVTLVPLLDGGPIDWRTDILLELPGQTRPMPVWWAVRSLDYLYVELQTGERELYDLTGRRGPPDPFDLQNVAGQPAYADVQSSLAARLQQLRL